MPVLPAISPRFQRAALSFALVGTTLATSLTSPLVTQAAPSSEPILRRLGFEEVCRLRRLEDPVWSSPSMG